MPPKRNGSVAIQRRFHKLTQTTKTEVITEVMTGAIKA
jgi:hypothetical protein